jgi:hypothetical protein
MKSYHQMALMVIFHHMYIKYYFELRIMYYKACNPTILNLFIVLKKVSLGLNDYK